MSRTPSRPRVAFLGAGPHELEVLVEVQAAGSVDLVAVYDPRADAPGLALAEVLGLCVGSDPQARARLEEAEFVVLPLDRPALREDVTWAGSLRAELVSLPEARRRWAGEVRPPALPRLAAASAEAALGDIEDDRARLGDRAALADWLLVLALGAVGANGGSIQLLGADTAELYLVAARGLSERLVRFGRHRVGEGVSGSVAATRAPQLVHGACPGRPQRERGDTSTSISLPLEDAGRLVGVLNVSSTVRGLRFGDEQLRTLERLTPAIARLLDAATRPNPTSPQAALVELLPRLEAAADLPAQLAVFCEHACRVFAAETATLHLTTLEGDWLAAARSPTGAQPAAVPQDILDRAFLEPRWLHVVEPAPAAGAEDVASAVERALEEDAPRRSRLHVPLVGLQPVGVLVLAFDSLAAAEECVERGSEAVQQLALACEAQVREHRAARRIERLAALARWLPRQIELRATPEGDAELAAEAAELVGARVAAVRRVSEAHRTYARPVVVGIPTGDPESWRQLDTRVTERTLQARRSVLSTAEPEPAGAPRRSLVSVPLVHENALVGVLNVYDKEPRDPLETTAFTGLDLDLLESLALCAGPLLAGAAGWLPRPLPLPAAGPGAALPPPRVPASHPGAARLGDPARAADVYDALQLELESAAREQRGVGVWLLRFTGLGALGTEAATARRDAQEVVRLGLRDQDHVAWSGGEDLVVVTASPGPAAARLEDRLRGLLRPLVARLARRTEEGIEVHIGACSFPQDGRDAGALLAAAARRAH